MADREGTDFPMSHRRYRMYLALCTAFWGSVCVFVGTGFVAFRFPAFRNEFTYGVELAAAIVFGLTLKPVIHLFTERHQDTYVPSWVGYVVILAVLSILPIVAIYSALND